MNNVVSGAKCNNKKLTHPPFNEFAPHQMMLFVCKEAFRLTLITCRPVSPLVRMIRNEGIILTQDRPKRTGPASLKIERKFYSHSEGYPHCSLVELSDSGVGRIHNRHGPAIVMH